ncbi:hypothetical protein LJM46_004888 [Escherichia coli]|nr:hypothetical protein [Escherichia coli]
MFFKNKVQEDTHAYRYEMHEKPHEIVRLQKLENAVRHYSGGIYSLHERVNGTLLNDNFNKEETVLLLKDISVYLRDLKIVGQLERDCFYHPGHGHYHQNKRK